MKKTTMIAGIIAAAYSFSALAATADVQVKPLTATAQKTANTADYLIGKTWVTTEALDQDGKAIPATDESVAGFFGLANYEKDGSVKMYTPEGKLKLQGDWSFSADGKTRTLTGKNDKGEVLFTRVVENIKVAPDEYIYRVYPKPDDKSHYADIVHKPKTAE
ncbi:DUF4822 domain-containing protein [Morganella morganii subsp. morganii]|uniref:DUF4822 domain-containing protein n=1 Tax=Morganella TaxID=581 RepID=UPI00040D6313|nr:MULTISPECIES: DUF4822 domain-containing protein [Morganella]AUU01937.1 DUF4822 domain-containing protein [Morganella morganii]AVD59406.1 DUF4822 domain-containing protein [Morganella morganii]EHZ6679265.1 DUF4822 domain-containing protein [Morganella morganii]EKQ1114413.1 DUF4822 domain-containing protein [Morganella morganii]EKU8062362.1 DUF4822 domain-containing protein [Morganella morganii]